MNDKKLLEHYVSLRDPEAGLWNLSPRSLYMELEVREFFQKHAALKTNVKVCNVGIGAGEWDDYLGYVLCNKGTLTSIDIDRDICELFQYRQKRERHPNPSAVMCTDILNHTLTSEQFDFVTIIGSTVKEIGNYEQTFEACFSLLRRGRMILYMDFHKYHHPDRFRELVIDRGYTIEQYASYDRYDSSTFYIFLVQKL
jgi:SAM-dependent methyltransferase